ncbi:CesT family type III secretion system chaperone [Pokkaliibacter sp. CJK22405]|uniref:CesT family type III secretion system chaperone n=1 Tax=Pokkaliibacter sp. CJK22405 TaxID=3384615 RepID=UPI003984D261
MSFNAFSTLIDRFCEGIGIADSEPFKKGDSFDIGGVIVNLAYSQDRHPDTLFIYVAFGTLPEGRELAAMAALLEQNYLSHDGHSHVFGCLSDHKNVVLTDTLPLPTLDEKTLLEHLNRLVDEALDWRKHYFLSNQPTAAAPAPKVQVSQGPAPSPAATPKRPAAEPAQPQKIRSAEPQNARSLLEQKLRNL